ncbi:MAG: hypothetical protein LUC49_04385 [Prevotella sp.]|nr:hypothetical protein [Prevotella sp.]MCD8305882.1 hypothetical protein [Prevotella sp.]
MKTILCAAVMLLLVAGCRENIEKRAAREADEYTRRNCPTPVANYSRTDSVKFDPTARAFVYYSTFVERFDSEAKVAQYRTRISEGLHNEIAARASMKKYVDAGICFVYIVRSERHPDKVLYQDTIRVEPRE